MWRRAGGAWFTEFIDRGSDDHPVQLIIGGLSCRLKMVHEKSAKPRGTCCAPYSAHIMGLPPLIGIKQLAQSSTSLLVLGLAPALSRTDTVANSEQHIL